MRNVNGLSNLWVLLKCLEVKGLSPGGKVEKCWWKCNGATITSVPLSFPSQKTKWKPPIPIGPTRLWYFTLGNG